MQFLKCFRASKSVKMMDQIVKKPISKNRMAGLLILRLYGVPKFN